jgi:general stress protein YciG
MSPSPKNRAAAALGKKGGKIGGLSRSAAKALAAQNNGKKGGRPKKTNDTRTPTRTSDQ